MALNTNPGTRFCNQLLVERIGIPLLKEKRDSRAAPKAYDDCHVSCASSAAAEVRAVSWSHLNFPSACHPGKGRDRF
jgi:hypothetical protein